MTPRKLGQPKYQNPAERIFDKGREAGLAGRPRATPHWLADAQEGPKELWLRGYDVGAKLRSKKEDR